CLCSDRRGVRRDLHPLLHDALPIYRNGNHTIEMSENLFSCFFSVHKPLFTFLFFVFTKENYLILIFTKIMNFFINRVHHIEIINNYEFILNRTHIKRKLKK